MEPRAEVLLRQTLEEHVQWCREAGLPLYGLSQMYHGLRALGWFERSLQTEKQTGKKRLETCQLELIHGEISLSQPALQITTAVLPGPTLQRLFDEEINQRKRLVTSPHLAFTLLINLDGRATPFEGYQSGGCWGVQAKTEGFSISVIGLHWPPEQLNLVSLDDLEPYIAGTIESLQRQIQEYRSQNH
jgi:hypothetical protein